MGIRQSNFTYDAQQEEVVAEECDLILFDDWLGTWLSAARHVRETEGIFRRRPAPDAQQTLDYLAGPSSTRSANANA